MAQRSTASEATLARIRANLEESAQVKRATHEACAVSIAAAGELLIGALRGGGQVLAFGNGGSASDAQHFAAELAGRFARERPALPALALTANTSDLTAIANDYGYDQSFARLVQAHGRPGDAALAISTSGSSENVNAAVTEARSRGLATIGLTGKGGGKLADLADVAVVVPSPLTSRVQEAHITICHIWCELVDQALFPEALDA